MAFISKQQQADILSKAPPGVTAEQVFSELVKRGNTIEGYSPGGSTRSLPSQSQPTLTQSPQQEQAPQEEDGFFKGVVKSVVKPISTGIASGINAIKATPKLIKEAASIRKDENGNWVYTKQGADEQLAKSVDLPYVGKTKALTGMSNAEAIGLAAQTASNLVSPGLAGALGAGGESLAEGNDVGTVARDTVFGYGLGKYGGKIIGKGLEYVPKPIMDSLNKFAQFAETKVTNPVNRTLSEKTSQLLEKPAKSLLSKVESNAGKTVLGDELAEAVSAVGRNPAKVEAFRTGKLTWQDVANKASVAIKEFSDDSYNAFQAIKNSLPGDKIGKATVNKVVNPILNVSETSLLPNEERVVNQLKKMVSANTDWTDKGILNLRSKIDRAGFFRESVGDEFKNSNAIITKVRKALNGVVTDKHEFIKDALEKATDDIQFVDRFETNIIGKNPDLFVERTAEKMRGLADKLDDPTRLKETKDLFARIQQQTGFDILDDLNSASAARRIEKGSRRPGLLKPVESAKNFVERGLVKSADYLSKKAQNAENIRSLSKIRSLIKQ